MCDANWQLPSCKKFRIRKKLHEIGLGFRLFILQDMDYVIDVAMCPGV